MMETNMALGGMMAMFGGMFLVAVAVAILYYLLNAWFLYKIAKKQKHAYAWMSWLPILQLIVLFQLAGMTAWWVALLVVPFLGGMLGVPEWIINIAMLVFVVVDIIAIVKLCQKLKESGWFTLVLLVPFLQLWGWYYLGKKQGAEQISVGGIVLRFVGGVVLNVVFLVGAMIAFGGMIFALFGDGMMQELEGMENMTEEDMGAFLEQLGEQMEGMGIEIEDLEEGGASLQE